MAGRLLSPVVAPGSTMARPSSLSRAGVAGSWGRRLAWLFWRLRNMKSKSCSAPGPATANPRSTSAVRLARSFCASRTGSGVGTAPWAKRGMAVPFLGRPTDLFRPCPVGRDHPPFSPVRRGFWTFPPARSNLALSHQRPAGVMDVRRALTVLTVVATLACWPVVARAAGSQPERRSPDSHSPAAAAAAVSVEADFDNDGFADLAVGVPREGVGGADLAGAVNVLAGSPAGLSGAGSQQWFQGGGGVPDTAEPFDFFGNALAAGDFNNDGFGDLAIGVPGEDVGTITEAGAVNVLYGSASGLAAGGGQFFSQDTAGVLGTAEAGDGFGAALGVGDFDNDGFADLAVGVPSEGLGALTQAGAVNVLYGSAGGLTAAGNQQFLQGVGGVLGAAEIGDEFGFAITSGDFNNNGFDDLAIGAISEDVGAIVDAGAVNVLYGSASRLSATGNQQFFQGGGGLVGVAEEGDFVGAALASGDYNNDTFADLAVGVPFEDVGSILDAGAVDTLNGSAGRLTPTGGQQFIQGSGGVPGTPEEGDTFGSSLA